MMRVYFLQSLFLLIGLSSLALAQTVTVQSESNVLDDGSAFLWLEGETLYDSNGIPPEEAEVGFIIVDKDNPIQGIEVLDDGTEVIKGGLDILTADTNASGGAGVFLQLGGGGTASWKVQFAIPATYYLYTHYSLYNRDGNTNYGNEDSVYVPPAFNAHPQDGWIDFEGVDANGDPKTGDSRRDGWMPLGKDIVDAGTTTSHNDTNEDFWDGQFHWGLWDVAVDTDANEAFVGDFGQGIQYEVTEADVGTVLDFSIAAREPYGAIDGFLFSTSNELLLLYTQEEIDAFFLNPDTGLTIGDFDGSGTLDVADVNMLSAEIIAGGNATPFDLNADSAVDGGDLSVWVKDLRKTWFGDANLDGEFNSGDLVEIFQAGKFELDADAGWSEGDWNADGRFDSGDLVSAFQDGGFEAGPVATASVPEPTALTLCALGAAMLCSIRRRAN